MICFDGHKEDADDFNKQEIISDTLISRVPNTDNREESI